MEQALSDLLPRSTVARFNVDALLPARHEGALGGVRDRHQGASASRKPPQWAREREGLAPGDVEYKPVPFAPPAAVPTRMPLAPDVAPHGRAPLRRHDAEAQVGHGPHCGKLQPLLVETGVFVGHCPRCKKEYPSARRLMAIVPIAAKAHHRAHIAPVARLLGIDAEHMPRAHRRPRRRGADRQLRRPQERPT